MGDLITSILVLLSVSWPGIAYYFCYDLITFAEKTHKKKKLRSSLPFLSMIPSIGVISLSVSNIVNEFDGLAGVIINLAALIFSFSLIFLYHEAWGARLKIKEGEARKKDVEYQQAQKDYGENT